METICISSKDLPGVGDMKKGGIYEVTLRLVGMGEDGYNTISMKEDDDEKEKKESTKYMRFAVISTKNPVVVASPESFAKEEPKKGIADVLKRK